MRLAHTLHHPIIQGKDTNYPVHQCPPSWWPDGFYLCQTRARPCELKRAETQWWEWPCKPHSSEAENAPAGSHIAPRTESPRTKDMLSSQGLVLWVPSSTLGLSAPLTIEALWRENWESGWGERVAERCEKGQRERAFKYCWGIGFEFLCTFFKNHKERIECLFLFLSVPGLCLLNSLK